MNFTCPRGQPSGPSGSRATSHVHQQHTQVACQAGQSCMATGSAAHVTKWSWHA
jgi:hypothetical protein